MKNGYLSALGTNNGPFDDIPIKDIIEYLFDLYESHDERLIATLNGKTGSGKSLCIAPFIYEFLKKKYHVVLSQPKITLAGKIAKDIGSWYSPTLQHGVNIGVKTSDPNVNVSKRNKLETGIDVVTTGVAYNIMLNGIEDTSNDTKVFIIDEVHDKDFVDEIISQPV